MSVLDEILSAKRAEVAALVPRAGVLEEEARNAPAARDFAGALRQADGALAVIAEIKRRSPSKGDLAPDLDPAVTAKAYAAGGAAALSVLTDGPYFGGSLDDLRAARAATALPALRKDFTIDPLQITEARAAGADAVLLIVAALPENGQLRDLREVAEGLGLACLVEAHDGAELDRALSSGARLVGVNCRDLGTFGEDLDVAVQLVERIPPELTAVAESAIRAPEHAEKMAEAGYDAVLVGEALVRAGDATRLVAALAAPTVQPRSS